MCANMDQPTYHTSQPQQLWQALQSCCDVTPPEGAKTAAAIAAAGSSEPGAEAGPNAEAGGAAADEGEARRLSASDCCRRGAIAARSRCE